MRDDAVLELLRESGAIKSGHFLLSSGKHSDQYVEKFDLLRDPGTTSRVLTGLSERLDADRIDVVVGPTTGGILLAFELGRQLDRPTAYAERADDGSTRREFRRGTTFEAGARILVIDDILTTGGSIRETLDALAGHPVTVTGVAVLVDRSGGAVRFGDLPVHAVASLTIETWDAVHCPLCASGVRLVKPGTTAVV
jgi:orotate phosphoribosyltransferase